MNYDIEVKCLGVAGLGRRPNRWGVFRRSVVNDVLQEPERVATIKRIGNQFELAYRGTHYPAKMKLADAVDLFRRIENGSY